MQGSSLAFSKINIAKDFDSVSWPFLLEVLEHLGFSRVSTNWILVLLSSASTKVMVSGIQGNRICHARGLHQGGPIPDALPHGHGMPPPPYPACG